MDSSLELSWTLHWTALRDDHLPFTSLSCLPRVSKKCDLSGTLIPYRCNFPVFPQGESRVQGQSVEVRVSEMNIIPLFLSLCSFLF